MFLLISLSGLLSVLAGPPSWAQADFINRCKAASQNLCDFICDCWDCSDENQCGFQKESVALGRPFTCDFEGSLCGWEDISPSAFRWVPVQASLSDGDQEPPFDHTRGTDLGWYLAPTKQQVKPSATARLRSPFMREASAACELHAWFHLSGAGFNQSHRPPLALELSAGNNTVTLWHSLLPSSTSPWRELVAFTGRIQGAFQLIFSATQDFSTSVQVALDDLEFRNCGLPKLGSHPPSCGPDELLCGNSTCLAADRFCDGTEDCLEGDDEDPAVCASFSICRFEEDWGHWSTELDQGFSWTRNSSLHVTSTSPLRDHSTNSPEGYFVYIDHGDLGQKQRSAWLLSPTLAMSETEPCYLVLYLYLHGSGTNSLNVYYRTEKKMELVQSRTGDLGDFWFREKVAFNVEEKFQIVIEGALGIGDKGSIALDDLILSPGCLEQNSNLSTPFEPEPPASFCAQDQFACWDNKGCIGVELVCDFKADCQDGSDEQECGARSLNEGSGGWRDLSVGRLQWMLQNISSQGRVLALSSEGPGQMLSMARAATPTLGPSGLACTLQLDYTTGHRGLLALAVVDEALRSSRWVWSALGNGTSVWDEARVPLGARSRPFQLELLASEDHHGNDAEGPTVAVGNVAFLDCNPAASPLTNSSGISCNFEAGGCDWFPDRSYGFEWELSTGQERGPDHTTGSGSFMSADPSSPGAQGLSARLVSSPQKPLSNSTCFSFWYRMEGPQIGTLNLFLKYAREPEQAIWSQTGSQGSVWHRASVTVPHPTLSQSFQLSFEALRNGFLGSMALDDFSAIPGTCGAPTRCSFEVDDCSLFSGERPSWVRQSGDQGSGPPRDHTLGSPQGHYLLLNTSQSALQPGQTAILRSLAFPPGRRLHCVTFWYHLRSSRAGSLRVTIKEGIKQKEEALDVSLVPGEAWQYVRLNISVEDDWQVAFAVEGAAEGPSSFLALDDLLVTEGGCLGAGSCDFERGPCGWSKPPGAWSSWGWKAGDTPSQLLSSKTNRTFGTKEGHYAFVDLALLGQSVARLASEPLPPATNASLRFHYYMDFLGQNSQAELRVKVSNLDGERTLWAAKGHQGHSWLQQTLLVSSLTEFQILLEATSGAWPNSETIAVDDVSYIAGPDSGDIEVSQETGGSRGPDAGLVAGIICSVLLVLLAAAMAVRYLKKWRVPEERRPIERSSVQGFDNVAFQNDQVTIPPLPNEMEAE
ncbi:apical endosomal glycoprotein [Anolis sagrei]|uniref:apical endosomal glycoprotein n=1 Tax=Anolis sagrei TaxID=38937 RepID=UPI0035224FE6